MKKFTWVLLMTLLGLAILPLTSQAAPLFKLSWRAEYYDNDSLSGAPKLAIYDAKLDHNWGLGSPAPEIPPDNFSARYTTVRHIEKGTYMFLLTVDDGARVWVDGKLVIDAWTLGCKTDLQAKVYLDQTGDHEIQVAYFEKTGEALIKLDWLLLAGENDILGAWQGEYFTNRDLAGEPTVTRNDAAINFDWNSDAPDPKITRDNFSVRWTRSIFLDEGVYTLRLQHDDGMRVYVDGKIIYDSWYNQSVTYQTRTVALKGGHRTFVVEFYDHIGNAVAYMSIDGDPGDYEDSTPEENATVVDETSPGFSWTGSQANRYSQSAGYGGSFWTYNCANTVTNGGQWTPSLGAGNYEVMAYIPGGNATTASARYQVYHYGERNERVVSQNSFSDQWVSLGTYYFGGGGNEYATLTNCTGEPNGSTRVAFDAVKFVKK